MSGFESYNTTTGTLQIDGVFKNYVLERVVAVQTDAYLTPRDTTSSARSSQGSTPMNPGEIVALRSNVLCAHGSVTNGRLYVRARGDPGQTVFCYFFAPISTSQARSGFQVFHEVTGELIFCASKKLLRLAGIANGNGDFTYDPARTYAAIMLNQYYKGETHGFVQNDQATATAASTRSMLTTIDGGIRVAETLEMLWIGFVGMPEWNATPPGTASDSAGVASHAIIDVTGY